MRTSPTVLLLVHDANEREVLTRRLTEVAVIPIAVHADTAIDALDAYAPVAAVSRRGTRLHSTGHFSRGDVRPPRAVVDAVAATPRGRARCGYPAPSGGAAGVLDAPYVGPARRLRRSRQRPSRRCVRRATTWRRIRRFLTPYPHIHVTDAKPVPITMFGLEYSCANALQTAHRRVGATLLNVSATRVEAPCIPIRPV